MTLIISALTHDYVVQASDRRLINRVTGKIAGSANKAVLFCGHIIFGYTGLATIEGSEMDFWLGGRLLSKAPDKQASLECVRDEATRAFQKVPQDFKKHAFVGVGWSRSRPILSVISNFMNADGNQLAHAQDQFRIDTVALSRSHGVGILPVGQSVPQEIWVKLLRGAKRIVKRAGPISMANLIANCIWEVAARNRMVGKDLMVSVIPRLAVPVKSIIIPSVLKEDQAAFYYVPSPDDRTPRFYTPLYACAGITSRGEIWASKPPWW
jgi:hypothetical protein